MSVAAPDACAVPDSPASDCPICPRLSAFRQANQEKFPSFHNAPVRSFGPLDARLLIVGLAPGLKGANQTGRPFTGDYAGDLLYATLKKYGFASGNYDKRPDDGLDLQDCRITNAVRCVPPENKPATQEIKECLTFLTSELTTLPNLKVLVALGGIAHGAALSALGLRKSHCKFAHQAVHELPNGLLLVDSYHCSRYNTNTGRLTEEMFEAVFKTVRSRIDAGG
ncbi:uracil-DNA glycosylase [Pelagibius sp. Alg239-R121]|uniref:uracil-DNA glycosylase n=1 Tax=Pelagibius sp. Alg239-R121 TaxID=2993448 RepID=UPI0024A6FFF1|nr:uracil-DNA glycosylase [Pelagibius sp. Alg239-R121]